MSDDNKNPCDDIESIAIPGPIIIPGYGIPPAQPENKFNPARFPRVEEEFPGVPVSRRSIVVPRNLYYKSPEEEYRSWQGSQDPELTHNNQSELKFFDAFRFIAGQVYTDDRFYNNKKLSDNLDFKVIVHPTEPVEFFEDANLTKNQVRCIMGPISVFKRFGQLDLNVIQEWLKNVIPEHDGWHYEDNAFMAPASFFASEANDLNMILPELTTMQVWFSHQITQDELDRTLAAESQLENERQKRSLYERFSMEYLNRPDYCELGDSKSVSVHKFPADKISLINNVTDFATNNESESEFSSFRRVFKRNYDFYTRISFDTSHESEIAKHMKMRRLDSLLMGVIDTESPSDETVYTQFLDEKIEDYRNVSNNDGVSINYRPNTYEEPSDKMSSYISLGDNSSYDLLSLALDPATYPLSYEDEESYKEELRTRLDSSAPLNTFYTGPATIRLGLFTHWLESYLEQKKRSFSKIMNSELSYSEVIAYRLEKKDQSGNVLQNFYFFNDPDSTKIDFLDTQVFFGKSYEYSLYTINMVVGSRYQYLRDLDQSGHVSAQSNPGGELQFDFTVLQSMGITLIEAPYFQQKLKVLDAPPLPPDIKPEFKETPAGPMTFFTFRPTVGEAVEEPISMREGDLDIIQNMRRAQASLNNPHSKITYKSDTDPTHYEMLVLDQPPTSYKDFFLGDMYETTILSPQLKVDARANQDFFITFRSRDLSGISNPTAVFKFRVNNYDGERPYIEFSQHHFEQQPPEYLMSFNRLMHVAPAPIQRAINFRKSPLYNAMLPHLNTMMQTTRGVDSLELGTDTDSILWDKKFMLEITSAVSGKKIKIMTTWEQLALSSEQDELDIKNFGELFDQSFIDSLGEFFANPHCRETRRRAHQQSNRIISDSIANPNARLSQAQMDQIASDYITDTQSDTSVSPPNRSQGGSYGSGQFGATYEKTENTSARQTYYPRSIEGIRVEVDSTDSYFPERYDPREGIDPSERSTTPPLRRFQSPPIPPSPHPAGARNSQDDTRAIPTIPSKPTNTGGY